MTKFINKSRIFSMNFYVANSKDEFHETYFL